MVFTKTISLTADSNLGGPKTQAKVNLLLAFNEGAIQSDDAVPAVWKIVPFLLRQEETQTANPVYEANIGITKAEVNAKQVVQPGITRHIDIGQQTDLELKEGTPTFAKPTNDFTKERFAVNNKLDSLPTVAAGLYNAKGKLNVISVWQEVPNQSTVDVGFTPVLSIYAASHYVESQLMPGHVDSLLWRGDLNDETLPDTVEFDLKWDGKNNNYILARTN